MSLTLKTIKEPGVVKFLSVTEVTFASSYTSGGETFTPANAGLQTIDHVWATLIAGDEAKSTEQFVSGCWYSGEKLHLLDAKTGVEVASTKNMEKVKVQVFAVGRSRAK